MKKTIVRIISLVMSVMVLLIAGAGCGQNSKPPVSTEGAGTTAADTTKATEAPQPISLEFAWGTADPQKESADIWSLVQDFMKKNPTITITFNGTAHDEHRKKMKLMAESNTLPDMFWEATSEWTAMANIGALTDITSLVDPVKSGYIDGAFDNFTTADGKIFGTPYMQSVIGVFYNKKIFDQYQIKIPETWDELLTAVKVLNENNIIPFAQGTKDPWPFWSYCLFMQRYGWLNFYPKFLDKQVKAVDDPNIIKAFARVEELRKAGAYPKNTTTVDYNMMKEMFFSGKAAMFNTGTWEMGALSQSAIANDLAFNFGPSFPDGVGDQKIGMKEITNGIYFGSKVGKDKDKSAAVGEFLKYLSSADSASVLAKQAQGISIAKTSEDFSSVSHVFGIIIKAAQDENKPVMQHYMYMPPELVSPFATAWWDGIGGVVNGILTPQEAAKKLDDWNATR